MCKCTFGCAVWVEGETQSYPSPSRTRKQAVKAAERQEKAATATEGLAAAAAMTAEAEEGDAVDEVVQSEINLRVAASKGDMAAILVAEQVEAYNIRTASLTEHCHDILAAPAPQPHSPSHTSPTSPTAPALSTPRRSPSAPHR